MDTQEFDSSLDSVHSELSEGSQSFTNRSDFSDDHVFGPATQSFSSSRGFDIELRDENGVLVKTKSFNQRFVLIGRSPDSDLIVLDDDVSHRHAYVQEIFGRYVCVDLASRTGLHWPEGRRPFGWFDESPIRIGHHELQFVSSDDPSTDNPSSVKNSSLCEHPEYDPQAFFRRVSDNSRLPKVSLQFLGRRAKHDAWSIQRPITLVGSSSRCKLRLNHDSVSRMHCSLNLTPDGLWVVDLLGKNGTMVDGELIRDQRLEEGAILKIGKYEFRVHYESNDSQLSFAGAESAPKPQSGLSEKAVGDLVSQIANMQKQFLDQSQQQSKMLLDFFGMMHTNQHNLLRDEMNRVQLIDQEMRELRRLLEKVSLHQQSAATEDSAADAANAPDRQGPQKPSDKFGQKPTGLHIDESAVLLDHANSDIIRSGDFSSDEQQERSDTEPTDEAPVSIEQSSGVASDSMTNDLSGTQSTEKVEVPQESLADESHHTQILQRMFQLEKEKEGIMKKMMRSMFS